MNCREAWTRLLLALAAAAFVVMARLFFAVSYSWGDFMTGVVATCWFNMFIGETTPHDLFARRR